MTSVLSLSYLSAGDITNVASALLYCSDNKAMSVGQWSDLGGFDRGAMWATGDAHTVYDAADLYTPMILNSLQWDTGSWTDANSVGIFRVPNDKWAYVECHFSISTSGGQTSQVLKAAVRNLTASSVGLDTVGAASNFDRVTVIGLVSGCGIIPVNSGDVIDLIGRYNVDSVPAGAFNQEHFWIGGHTLR